MDGKWHRPRTDIETLSGFNRWEKENHGREAGAAGPVRLRQKEKNLRPEL